jgi:hypothetical protein
VSAPIPFGGIVLVVVLLVLFMLAATGAL